MSGLRKDRFFCSIPFVSEKKFRNSNFLRWYNNTDSKPGKGLVIRKLYELPNGLFRFCEICNAIKQTSDDCDIIRIYTSDIKVDIHTTFYTYINEQLSRDNDEIIQKLMPLIRRATGQINYNGPTEDCIVYRGMQLDQDQCDCFQTGTRFRFPGFTSTSASKVAAEKFGNILFKIHIKAGCLQVKNIQSISWRKDELEYLFSPYSLFEVIYKSENLITLKAIDNRNEVEKSLPNSEPLPDPEPLPNPKPHLKKVKKVPTTISDDCDDCWSSVCILL